MQSGRVIVIGAGMAGLVAALQLAARGVDVTVLERANAPGGKLRELAIGGVRIDSGPTVFTLRRVFDEIFASVGTTLSQHLTLTKLDILARHAWTEDQRLDLFADIDRSADAIGAFAGAAEAQGYRAFCERAAHIYRTLDAPFIHSPEPGMLSLVRDAGVRDLVGISAFATMWNELGNYFKDVRLRQLFGRYATYTGCSPFRAPASLMLIAHVEQEGVWTVDGGMHRIASVLAGLATARGARFRYGADVAEILTTSGRASGVRLANGERLEAETVIVNGDAAAVGAGLFGRAASRAAPLMRWADRSFSAMTWSISGAAGGFPLVRHNVFFSPDSQAEFDLLARGQVPDEPTVYLCAQDRGDSATAPPDGPERMFCIVNAPANGDTRRYGASEIATCERRMFQAMRRCGLTVQHRAGASVVTTPADFHRLFPATGGALYGRAGNGWRASFQRPFARTKLPGLILAGGSTHPGAGVPMAALSGTFAASCALADLASIRPSRVVAMRGGMSTR